MNELFLDSFSSVPIYTIDGYNDGTFLSRKQNSFYWNREFAVRYE